MALEPTRHSVADASQGADVPLHLGEARLPRPRRGSSRPLAQIRAVHRTSRVRAGARLIDLLAADVRPLRGERTASPASPGQRAHSRAQFVPFVAWARVPSGSTSPAQVASGSCCVSASPRLRRPRRRRRVRFHDSSQLPSEIRAVRRGVTGACRPDGGAARGVRPSRACLCSPAACRRRSRDGPRHAARPRAPVSCCFSASAARSVDLSRHCGAAVYPDRKSGSKY
jgi:hypothetical protein